MFDDFCKMSSYPKVHIVDGEIMRVNFSLDHPNPSNINTHDGSMYVCDRKGNIYHRYIPQFCEHQSTIHTDPMGYVGSIIVLTIQ